MPRPARLDAPDVLHHIIIRGIERRNIFRDNKNRDNFIDRLSDLLPATQTTCYAWAFIPNHAHFLFRSSGKISTLMRRLLTGYAIYFNRRHRRHGQLFLSEPEAKQIQTNYLSGRHVRTIQALTAG